MREQIFIGENAQRQYQISCPHLPLAVYRELVAHLLQVAGVEVDLLPQRSQQFDYLQSQVGGVSIQLTPKAGATAQCRVKQILGYYSDRYGAWESIPATPDFDQPIGKPTHF